MIDTGEVLYENIGRGLIVLCGGSIQDKIESIGVLYEKYGIQDIESSELANLIKGMLKIFHSIDPSIFEKVTLTEASSIVVSRCWNDLNLSSTEAVMLIQLYNWILGKPDRGCISQSKSEKRFKITNSLRQCLGDLLRTDMMVEFINVIIPNNCRN